MHFVPHSHSQSFSLREEVNNRVAWQILMKAKHGKQLLGSQECWGLSFSWEYIKKTAVTVTLRQ